jgi:hypothetical protein
MTERVESKIDDCCPMSPVVSQEPEAEVEPALLGTLDEFDRKQPVLLQKLVASQFSCVSEPIGQFTKLNSFVSGKSCVAIEAIAAYEVKVVVLEGGLGDLHFADLLLSSWRS